jgi:parallel beta-helix repeat protein
MSIAILTFNILRVNPESSGQPAAEWSKTFGGTKEDYAVYVEQTNEGGYIIGGGTCSFGAGGFDAWLINVDSVGNVQWNKTYGNIGDDGEGFGPLHQTGDGGYIFTASFSTVVNGTVTEKKLRLVKTDSLGNLQWNKSNVDYAVELTGDGGYIMAGSKWIASSFNFWLVKMDGGGNVQWEKTYGGALHEEARSVQQTSDGGYIIAGTVGNLFDNPRGEQDALLVKTDSTGNMQWNKTYGDAGVEWLWGGVRQTDDGGFVFAGSNPGVWLVKTDPDGNQQWTKSFGGSRASSVQQTNDGGYVVAGMQNYDFLLIKTDSLGNVEWSKTFGGAGVDSAECVQVTADGGYIVAGYTESYGAGNRDAWVIKLAGPPPSAEIWVPDNYTRIEWAIGNASDGDTIRVRAGTYCEHLTISKSLKIIGEDRTNTIIDGNQTGTFVVRISANNVVLSGFTIRNSSVAPNPAIRLEGSNNIIYNNTIVNNGWGIYAFSVSGNIITNNIITGNLYGVYLEWADNHIIKGNTITNHHQASIYLRESPNNLFRNNIIENNKDGIVLISYSNYNKIYHNNFINNISPGFAVNSDNNVWDDGYPLGGNYWSDYTGADLKHGSGQNLTGSDGIGDTPHSPSSLGTDSYPLMGLSGSFEAGTWDDVTYHVQTVSNSTVSDFYFNPDEGAFLRFNVTGDDGTSGFCRVAIPKDLLWVDDGWTVYVGEESITNYTIIPDENYTYLYFTYNHSTKTVEIQGTHVIPEFPSLVILPLLALITFIATILPKKKRKTKPQLP